MKILLSVPSGYHAREILLPLKELLDNDGGIEQIVVVTPAASYRDQVFNAYGAKYIFEKNPESVAGHIDLLQRYNPSIVVTPTSGLDYYDVPLLQAATQLSLRTLTFVASWDNVYKMERLKKYGKPYVLAQRFAVWNQMMKDHLLRVFPEVSSDNVSIVGAPRLDFFSHTDRIPTKEALYKYLNLADTKKGLLHLATTELYPMDYLAESIMEGLNLKKIVKPLHIYASVHPGGDIAKHERYAEQNGITVRYSFGRRQNTPLPGFIYNPTLEETYMLVALFKYTDVLINHSSTVAIESFFCDVPVINVKYGQRWDWWRWRRSMVYRDFQQHYRDITNGQATDIVHNENQLIEAINQSLQNPLAKQQQRLVTLKKLVTYTDGSSGTRLLALIKEHAAV